VVLKARAKIGISFSLPILQSFCLHSFLVLDLHPKLILLNTHADYHDNKSRYLFLQSGSSIRVGERKFPSLLCIIIYAKVSSKPGQKILKNSKKYFYNWNRLHPQDARAHSNISKGRKTTFIGYKIKLSINL